MGAIVYHREEISNFILEISVIVVGIIWSEKEGKRFFPRRQQSQ